MDKLTDFFKFLETKSQIKLKEEKVLSFFETEF